MKMSIFRLLFLGLVSLSLMVGCASTPDEPDEVVIDNGAKMEAQRAISDAKAARQAAAALGHEWNDTGPLIAKAEQYLSDGDFAAAKKTALEAKAQAEAAQDQYYLQQAKFKLDELNKRKGLNAEQRDLLSRANAAYAQSQGRQAYELASRLEASLAAARTAYMVTRGDNLWNISGQSGVYGDPYQWPLIYKANTNKIKDADLIFPGQELQIERSPSSAEVNAAVNHAKSRGAWSIGVVEDSDRAYLAR